MSKYFSDYKRHFFYLLYTKKNSKRKASTEIRNKTENKRKQKLSLNKNGFSTKICMYNKLDINKCAHTHANTYTHLVMHT